MRQDRTILKAGSNNKANPNKNICALAVANALGVAHKVRYLHKVEDVVRAARTQYTVRSRKSSVKGSTIGAIRKSLQKIAVEERACYFIVRVPGHVVLMGIEGQTLIDTDPRKNDRRKITHVYAVFP